MQAEIWKEKMGTTRCAEALRLAPQLGSGIGYRDELAGAIASHRDEIDVLEVITERFLDSPGRLAHLEQLCEHFHVVPHGVDLSIGSDGPLDRRYLQSIREVSEITRSPYYSDHLCMTRVPGIRLGHLTPLWFTESVLMIVTDRVRQVQDFLGKPLVLENVTYLFDVPRASLSQAEFFCRLVDATECGVLLDLTNVYINSVNHGIDPMAFLEQMPLGAVVHVHVSGGHWSGGVLVDSHAHPVQEESWRLLQAIAHRSNIKVAILEQDASFADPGLLFTQVGRMRAVLQQKQSDRPGSEVLAGQE